jgi:hypothetical protein
MFSIFSNNIKKSLFTFYSNIFDAMGSGGELRGVEGSGGEWRRWEGSKT